MLNKKIHKALGLGFIFLLAAAYAYVLAALLYSSWCAFTHFHFSTHFDRDYVSYTNMIWNTGQGDLFRFFRGSYLRTHLSFTLGLLGPLLRAWDHPFMLSLLQWGFLAAGSAILARSARRLGLSLFFALAIALFHVTYHFSQRVQLDSFHGVSAYLLLIPWLYYCLSSRKPMSWLPIILILGLREEAGLMIVAPLLYFAVKDRWRTGYIYAALCIIYVLCAVFILYPVINHASLFEVRKESVGSSIFETFNPQGLLHRAQALGWVLIPLLPFLGRGWRPALAFCALPVSLSMVSAFPYQYALHLHFPAVVMAWMSAAMIEGARTMRQRPAPHWQIDYVIPAYLVMLCILSYIYIGFLPGSRRNRDDIYLRMKPDGIEALRVAQSMIPTKGVLLPTRNFAGFCANRKKLIVFDGPFPEWKEVDILFCRPAEISPFYLAAVSNGTMGVKYLSDSVVLIEKGFDTGMNHQLLDWVTHPRILFANTHAHGGQRQFGSCAMTNAWRYWEGDGSRGPINLSYGTDLKLEAGSYSAVFTFRSAPPIRTVRDSWGWLSIHQAGARDPIVNAGISPDTSTTWRTQSLSFTIPQKQKIEPRVTGADAELWLDSVEFLPMQRSSPPKVVQ